MKDQSLRIAVVKWVLLGLGAQSALERLIVFAGHHVPSFFSRTRVWIQVATSSAAASILTMLLALVGVILGLSRLFWIRQSRRRRATQKEQQQQPAAFDVEKAVAEIQTWLFEQGGHQHDVRSLIMEYCVRVRKLGLPLDRLFVGSGAFILRARTPVMVWRWQVDEPFHEHEVPRETFNLHRSNNEPFTLLLDRSADSVRLRAGDDNIPPDCCKWFVEGHFQDYLALPILSRNEMAGGLAWATRDPAGFSDDHIRFLHESLPAFGIVMRLHSNDFVVNLLTLHLEEQVAKRTNELEVANHRLEAANMLQAQQCHELRTPLNAILGLSSVLMDTNLDSEQREAVKLISSSGDHMRGAVESIVDWSKLELGEIKISLQPVNLKDRLETVVKSVECLGAGRRNGSSPNDNEHNRIHIRCTYDANLPTMIYTDGRRLQQILINIFTNAVKFSNDETNVIIDFKVDMTRDDKGDDEHVVFRVKDYGLGIEKKDMEHIFEPFNQLTQETRPVYGGCGLGLPITAKIVESLGGRITVDSIPGEWCEFVVHLPHRNSTSVSCNGEGSSSFRTDTAATTAQLQGHHDKSSPVANGWNNDDSAACSNTSQIVHPKPPPKDCCTDDTGCADDEDSFTEATRCAEPNDSTSSLESSISNTVTVATNPIVEKALGKTAFEDLRVLVAEDNAINVKVLGRILSRLGLTHVDVVGDGKQAVESSAANQYDVIFMDIQMPVMDGLEATRLIVKRRAESGEDSPRIVFLTAHALDSYRLQAQEAGGDAFLSKPYKLQDIQESLESLESL